MDNMEENSRSTEQDRVANPVEKTVSTTVEPALSENKRERKKREKAEKKKNAPDALLATMITIGVIGFILDGLLRFAEKAISTKIGFGV